MIPILCAMAMIQQQPAGQQPAWMSVLPYPPAMPKRPIASTPPWPGDSTEIQDGDRKITLFWPSNWSASEPLRLTIHFHGAVWHAVQEHVARGTHDPLIVCYAGEGSSIYKATFDDKQRWDRWLEMVRLEAIKRGAAASCHVAAVDLTSFSAGYGAIREIVQMPAAFRLLRRVILADSMYASLDAGLLPDRVVAKEHVDVWLPLAQAAARGEKTFAVTFSQVPTPTYASSSECAAAIVKAMGGSLAPVEPGSCVATIDPEFPLLSRFDRGSLHFWGYGGDDAQAHMTHARHIADIWTALDAAGRP